jgi:hypothetical protein
VQAFLSSGVSVFTTISYTLASFALPEVFFSALTVPTETSKAREYDYKSSVRHGESGFLKLSILITDF